MQISPASAVGAGQSSPVAPVSRAAAPAATAKVDRVELSAAAKSGGDKDGDGDSK
jgi:hypothetical protein